MGASMAAAADWYVGPGVYLLTEHAMEPSHDMYALCYYRSSPAGVSFAGLLKGGHLFNHDDVRHASLQNISPLDFLMPLGEQRLTMGIFTRYPLVITLKNLATEGATDFELSEWNQIQYDSAIRQLRGLDSDHVITEEELIAMRASIHQDTLDRTFDPLSLRHHALRKLREQSHGDPARQRKELAKLPPKLHGIYRERVVRNKFYNR